MNPAILVAGDAHCGVLAALHGGCFTAAWSAGDFAELLAMPGAFALIANGGDTDAPRPTDPYPQGFCLARTAVDECEIIVLGVSALRRGRGIGARLIAAILDRAAADGARLLFLEVAARNLAARRLYLSTGFLPVGRRQGYYRDNDGQPDDAVIMRQRLPPH